MPEVRHPSRGEVEVRRRNDGRFGVYIFDGDMWLGDSEHSTLEEAEVEAAFTREAIEIEYLSQQEERQRDRERRSPCALRYRLQAEESLEEEFFARTR